MRDVDRSCMCCNEMLDHDQVVDTNHNGNDQVLENACTNCSRVWANEDDEHLCKLEVVGNVEREHHMAAREWLAHTAETFEESIEDRDQSYRFRNGMQDHDDPIDSDCMSIHHDKRVYDNQDDEDDQLIWLGCQRLVVSSQQQVVTWAEPDMRLVVEEAANLDID